MKFVLLGAAVALLIAPSPSHAQQPIQAASCTLGCVSFLQAVGDEMKEQIFLDCDQIGGGCTGSGKLTVAGTEVPIRLEGKVSQTEVVLTVKGDGATFAPTGSTEIKLDLVPDTPQQAYRVDLVRVPDMGAAPVAVTVIVSKLI